MSAIIIIATIQGLFPFVKNNSDAVYEYLDYTPNLAQNAITVPRRVENDAIYHYDESMSVQDKIKWYAKLYGVDVQDALRIAKCESNFDASAENVNGSATGVYQIIRKTWKTYGGGNVYNADHNIIVFMQQYPKHPDWWECK